MELYGRTQIFTEFERIDESNVVEALASALSVHQANIAQIDYLYDYYRGKQPIRLRHRDVRPELTKHIVENHAHEIVNFKVGYLCTENVQYVARDNDEDASEAISKLNAQMDAKNRAAIDKQVFEWDAIAGTAYKFVMQDEDARASDGKFSIFSVDPRDAFVIYSTDIARRPLAGVYYNHKYGLNGPVYNVYTDNAYYKVTNDGINGLAVVDIQRYPFGHIPLIEYPANHARLGSFEIVISLLDSINELDSQRQEGVESFIQSLAVAYNCQFEEGTTANDIMQAGMLVLRSLNDNKADFKILSQELNQSQTQTLKEDLKNAIIDIAGLPSKNYGSTSDSSNNGAVVLKNGWRAAETGAKNSELFFNASETEMLKVVIAIERSFNSAFDLRASDIAIKMPRRNYEDMLAKSTTLLAMLNNNKVHPKIAYETASMFPDVEEAYRMGMEWYESHPTEDDIRAAAQEEEELEQAAMDGDEPAGMASLTGRTAQKNKGNWVQGYYR